MEQVQTHLSNEELDRYRSGRMSPLDLLSADDHLAVCDSCYERFGGDEPLNAAYELARATLSAPDLEGYEYHSGISSAKESAGSSSKLAMVWQSSFWRTAFQLAAAAIIIVLATLIATSPLKSQLRETNTSLQDQTRSLEAMQGKIDRLRDEQMALEKNVQMSRDNVADIELRLWKAEQSNRLRVIAPANRVLASLKDANAEVTLYSGGRISGLKLLTPSDERLIREALITGGVRTSPVLSELIDKSGVQMGDPSEIGPYPLLSPVGTVVSTNYPTFRWHKQPQAQSYVVRVYDARSGKLITESLPLSQTEWTTPMPLATGKVYTWQIRMNQTENRPERTLPGPGPQANFSVLNKSAADRIERAKLRYAESPLVLGILYAKAGLLDEAERSLTEVVRLNRDSSLAAKLLDSIKAKRQR